MSSPSAQDKTEVKRWAADKRGVSALCYGPTADTPTLISAGAQIKVWNLTTYTELKVRRCRKQNTNAASLPPFPPLGLCCHCFSHSIPHHSAHQRPRGRRG